MSADEELSSLVGSEGSPGEYRDIDESDDFADPADMEEPTYTFDFSKTSEVKDGIYHARCQRFVMGTSQNGNPQFELRVYLPELKRSLDTQLSCTEAAAGITGDSLRAMGVKPGADGTSFKRSQVEGLIFRVRIANETFEGIKRPKIKGYLPKNEQTEDVFSALDNG